MPHSRSRLGLRAGTAIAQGAGMRTPLLSAVLLLSCGHKVESTFVTGSVGGVTFSAPVAISHTPGSGASPQDSDTILITDEPDPCSKLVGTGLFSTDAVQRPDSGTRSAALILRGGFQAYLDIGNGSNERFAAAAATAKVVERGSDGTLKGTFGVRFDGITADGGRVTLPDGGSVVGELNGDFIAPACVGFKSGCSATAASALLPLAALMLLRLRRRR